MLRRFGCVALAGIMLVAGTGCELTASMYVQQEYNTNPTVFTKPDGLAKAEVKITRLIGEGKVKK